MAIDLLAATKDFAEELRTATGKRVWISRKDIQPPGFYVALDQIEYVLAGDIADLRFAVYAVSPDVGEDEERALKKLDELHAALLTAGYYPEGLTTVVGLNIPSTAKAVPALEMTITRDA